MNWKQEQLEGLKEALSRPRRLAAELFVLATFSLLFISCLFSPAWCGQQPNIKDKPVEHKQDEWTASYMERLRAHLIKCWHPPQLGVSQHIVATWTIQKNGRVSGVQIVTHGPIKESDRAVLRAISDATPFEALPEGTNTLGIHFDFVRSVLGLTVDQAIKRYGPDAKKRIIPSFNRAGVQYPPPSVSFVCFKDADVLLVFAREKLSKWRQIKSYSLVSRSGVPGPKLKEGDMQVPEGVYKITGLDARTHLAMLVNYPNAIDRAHAIADHRTKLGGYIQIHSGTYSTGCLVLKDEDMQELMILGHDTGCQNIKLIVAPCNLLTKKPDVDFHLQPVWLPALYEDLRISLAAFPFESETTKTNAGSPFQ